jgi:hypothetical protein
VKEKDAEIAALRAKKTIVEANGDALKANSEQALLRKDFWKTAAKSKDSEIEGR